MGSHIRSAALALATVFVSSANAFAGDAWVQTSGGVHHMDYICETPGSDIYLLALGNVGAEVMDIPKGSTVPTLDLRFGSNGPDGALGHEYHSLLLNGREQGQVVVRNQASPPQAETVSLASGVVQTCRMGDGVRFFGFDNRRAFMVTGDNGGGFTYQSFNFPNDDGVTVYGGSGSFTSGMIEYSFPSGEYRFVVREFPGSHTAEVEVQQDGRHVQTEILVGYFTSP